MVQQACVRELSTLDIDLEALTAKYRRERDRRLRPDGEDQYLEVSDALSDYAEQDPFSPPVQRAPLSIDIDVAVMGGGFAGLLAGANLQAGGIEDFRIIEMAGDFGGTWYWNRYPGAQCDVDACCYLPLLEETGYIPTEKYAYGPEIHAHCQRIGRQFDLYRRAIFGTIVRGLRWDEGLKRWRVSTDKGDGIRARFLVMAAGSYNRPKLPGIPGLKDFKGRSFHTSRWDYGYTGGGVRGGLSGLSDKNVAVIGAGATAVQCVPHLGRDARRLYVFQRTPSAIDVRGNRPTDPEWVKTLKPGWQSERQALYHSAFRDGLPPGVEDPVCDGWTEINASIAQELAAFARGELSQDALAAARELADHRYQEKLRRRVDAVVRDPETAERLKAWYRFNCKRPCFSDDYLETFNRPNVTLVDVSGTRGVERITDHAIVADGVLHPVDCIVYATGFEVTTSMRRRLGIDVVEGRGGQSLYDHWKDGFLTFHGYAANGFPNMFFTGYTQSAVSANYTVTLDNQTRHIAHVIGAAQRRAAAVVEATKAAVDYWQDEMRKHRAVNDAFLAECTPGYHNNEGGAVKRSHVGDGYAPGVNAFNALLARWREDGDFAGLAFDGAAAPAPMAEA